MKKIDDLAFTPPPEDDLDMREHPIHAAIDAAHEFAEKPASDHRPYIEVVIAGQGGTTHAGACLDCGWGTLWTADIETVRAEAESHIRSEWERPQ